MKEGWEYRLFESCLVKVPKQVQVKSKDYKKRGKYPIVSQEAELISGYWDDETIVYKHKEPVVIFGDHTKNIKYIDFNFVVGADGTHILSTKKDINTKYFYYVLKSIRLRDLVYARHYKLLKEKSIPVPPLSEQQSIVDYLDSAFAKIDAMKANAEKALNEAKALFQASLKEMLEPKEGWEEKNLGDCFFSINNGANIKQAKGAKGIPITRIETLSNDKFNRERLGYADILDASPYTSYILNDGDILMSHINSMKYLGRAVRYSKKEDETIIHGMNLLRLVPKNNVLSSCLIYQFYTAFFRNQIATISHQSVNQASFNTTNLKSLKLIIPSLSEQQSIVETLDSLKSKVDRLQENYNKISQECDALKQAILRQVFE